MLLVAQDEEADAAGLQPQLGHPELPVEPPVARSAATFPSVLAPKLPHATARSRSASNPRAHRWATAMMATWGFTPVLAGKTLESAR